MMEEDFGLRLREVESDVRWTITNTTDLKLMTNEVITKVREHRESARHEFGLVRAGIDKVQTGVAEFREDAVGRFDAIYNRFDGVDEQFSKVSEQFSKVDEQFSGVHSRLDSMERTQREILDLLKSA